MRLMFTLLFTIAILMGCSAQKSTPEPAESSYPSVIILNNVQYSLSVEKIKQDKIGKQLGIVKHKVEQMPKENEESNDAPVGSKLYEIKDVDQNDAIAVEINGEYRKALKIKNTNSR